MRSRGWIFVINNYTDEDIAYLMAMYKEDKSIKYMAVGFEVGERLKTKHIQGYVYFINPTRQAAVRYYFNIDGKQHHVEAQKAKANVNAYVYCMKGRDVFEFGNRPRQGNRTDLEAIQYDLDIGRPIDYVRKEYFSQWIYHRRAFNEYIEAESNYRTQLWFYDREKPFKVSRHLKEYYTGVKYKLIFSCVPIDEIMQLYHSGIYEQIFVPNHVLYNDYVDEFEGMINV